MRLRPLPRPTTGAALTEGGEKNLMLGVRDLDSAEGERLNPSAIHVVKWRDH